MIAADQPSLEPGILIRISSCTDGTVLDRSIPVHDESVVTNRRAFCAQVGVNYEQVVYQRIVYNEAATYRVIAEVDERSTTAHIAEVTADALFTRTPGVGLFLPVADCVATVIYDPHVRALALLHLGRHSTLTDLLPLVLAKFVAYGSKPADQVVWMSPSAQRASYRLDHFALKDLPNWQPFRDEQLDGIYLDMQGFNRQRCLDAGLANKNIFVSSVDTMKSPDYFSHANGDTHGRMAVLAMMV